MSQIRRISNREDGDPKSVSLSNGSIARKQMLASFEKEGSLQIQQPEKSFALQNFALLVFPFLSLAHALFSPEFGSRSGRSVSSRYWIFLYSGYLIWAVALFFIRREFIRES